MASQLALLFISVVLLNLFHLHTEILKTNCDLLLAHALQFSGGTCPYSENRELDSVLGGPFAWPDFFFQFL